MAEGPLDRITGARAQLEQAIKLLDSDDISAHSLADAAYTQLRDLLALNLSKLEKAVKLREIPSGFFRHADDDRAAILTEHSAKTPQLMIRLAILLWEKNEQTPTPVMQEFIDKKPNPYQPKYRHHAIFEAVKEGYIPDVKDIVTLSSTVSGNPIIRPTDKP